MEEDDDFGELYTDVLRPFDQSQSATSPQPQTTTSQIRPQFDLNTTDADQDKDTLFRALHNDSNEIHNLGISKNDQNGVFLIKHNALGSENGGYNSNFTNGSVSGGSGVNNLKLELDLGNRVLGGGLEESRFGDGGYNSNFNKGGNLVEKEGDLGKEVEIGGDLGGGRGDLKFGGGGGESMEIPGLSNMNGGDSGDLNFEEETDSESEDDLQIVLNNDNEMGVMGMERMGGIGEDDDDDDDGDPLVILAGNDTSGNPPMVENQEWGEDAGIGADGERKELGEASKVNGGVAVHPKVPYGNQSFHHPFHSQFKYVRPGVAPLAGPGPSGTVGTVGQVRPPLVGHIPGRGRGDWRSPGMQKGFHPGFGAQAWGSSSSGRGLDFTLPSHKTIFEVDIDSFEDKPWRLPGIDMSDFFNFGLHEEGWKEYCRQLEQHRLETSMQSRIRTYESGRTEQDYDPDLPPELAAASGVQGIPSENITLVTMDPGQDPSNRARPPLPPGRPIQVETNFTDRLPSADTRQPRIRDPDAIIEINCRGLADEGSPEIDMVEPEDDHILDEDISGGDEIQVISDEHTKKERRRGHTMNFSSQSSTHRLRGSREATPQFSGENSPIAKEERRMKGRIDRSPRKATSETTREKQSADDQNEKSYESIDGKHCRLSLSSESVGAAMEEDVEHQLSIPNDEPVRDNSPETGREGLDLDVTSQDDMLRDENISHSSGKQKSSSKVELSQETDEIDNSRAASSEDNKAGSRNRKGLGKSREAVDEVSQGEGSAHMSKMDRSINRDDNMIRRKGYNERKDAGRRHTPAKSDGSYAHKASEPKYTNHLHAKTDGADRRRESVNKERDLHKSDEGLHGRQTRVEDMIMRDHVDEIGSRHRNKVRESERSEKDQHNQLREHLDINSRRGNNDKVIGSKRHRDDGLRRDECIDSLHNKRRKEDGTQRREQIEKEIIFHGNRDSSGRRRRERDDVSDERKRDQPRIRDDDVYTVRYKEEGMLQRERGERQRDRDDRHRVKHSSEDMLSKREREDVMSGMNSVRAADEKLWSINSRVKDEYRGSGREYYQKDAAQQSKRSDRSESESLVQHRGREDIYAHGNQQISDGRRVRHERVSTRDDRVANASDTHRVHERKPKEYPRKGKDHEGGYPDSVPLSSKNQDESSRPKSDLANSKGELQQSSENPVHGNHRSSSGKLNEVVPSDDEQHHSRRGRSKLERWASHKERDFSTITKSSSSLQIKEPEAQNSSGPSNEHPKPVEDKQLPPIKDKPVEDKQLAAVKEKPVEEKQLAAIKDKDALETNNAEGKSADNKHLDTVEKLKKRSERFKLPMPGEKEITTTKKVENESLPPPPPPPPSEPETHPDTEIKPERPARKRRWTSN